VRIFILSIALCHTCLPEINESKEISFNGASPDEQALVQAAQELGFVVIDRQNATLTLQTFPAGRESKPFFETYHILDVIEFSSTRKRMSIIVRMPDNRICVFCKGADSMVMKRLRLSGLALEKSTKVEQFVKERQSLEAQEAIRRNSEHQNRKSGMARSSLTMNRHSIGAVPRTSTAGGRLQPIRDELNTWLKERETEIEFLPQDNGVYGSPRPSVHFNANLKSPPLDGRLSFQQDGIDDLIDDAMALDDAVVFERCFQHINDFATEGLRTLLYGYRYIEEEEYRSWKKIYLDAATSLTNRQDMVEKAGSLIETNLELAGATAIEDKLQDGVPEAIDKLRRAKIKMWMLTGDKRETAINIGHSCRLIKDYSSIIVLDHETGDVNQRIAAAFVEFSREQVAHSVVVIDGQTLSLIDANDTSRKLFIDLAILVDSVICCRASPSQKSYLVGTIRKKVKNAVTLAIGDGANDIAMIQEAHVGIGITGKEGLQAARTSDYSIAQFRFLLRLLLVHGRWNYIRTCKYTLGTFWKEMIFYLTQALYQRYVGYTGTSLYESWSLAMFNTLFTSLPVIFMGIFEKDLAASTLLAIPELYSVGQRNGGFNLIIYACWMFIASAEAMIVFFVMVGLYGQARSDNNSDLYAMGTLTYSACVVIIATKLQFLDLHNKSITCVVAMVGSIGGWAAWNVILSGVYSDNVVYDVRGGLVQRFGRNGAWWLTLFLILAACWTFEIAVKSIKIACAPGDVDVFQELEKDDQVRKTFETAARAGMECNMMGGEEMQPGEDERASEEQRREEDVQELLERPRAVMGNDGKDGAVRRRRFSESMSRDGEHEPETRHTTAGTSEDHQHERGDNEEEDANSEKARKDSFSSATYRRRSTDIQELLRRGFGAVRRSFDAVST
jgi:phospholipid-translocating ATPase